MRRKLRDTGGFSFVETLCATAILVLLCVMMYTGIQMALKTYREVTAESELRLMRNSLFDVLVDQLRCATVSGPDDGGGGVTPQKCTFGGIIGPGGKLEGVTIDGDGILKVDGSQVLSDGAYGEKIPDGSARRYRVDFPGGGVPLIRYDSGHFFVINFTVTDTRTHISQAAELTVRCLNPVKKE